MATYLLPAIYVVGAWWLSTGLALRAVGIAGRAPRPSMAAAAGLFCVALAALAATAPDASPAAAYIAFTAALAVWGVQEVAFLAGWITGPWRQASPIGIGAWSRARYAVAAILHHELALAASGLAIVAATWNGANQIGAWTFAVLFGMRISAKLNVFLGVPNVTEGFLPTHLGHLKSFFGRKPMNLLFPVSVSASTVLLAALAAAAAGADGADATGLTLLATLVGLALLEHWFLVLPIPIEALWAWGQSGAEAAPDDPVDSDAGAQVLRLTPRASGQLARASGERRATAGGGPRLVHDTTQERLEGAASWP